MVDKYSAAQFLKTGGQTLSNPCNNLCMALSTGNESAIDGKELAVEVKTLPGLPSDHTTAFELLTFIQTHTKKTFGEMVSQSVGCSKSRLHSACDCGFRKEELLKAEAHQELPKVFRGMRDEQLSYEGIINDFLK